jgi:formylglycine-generating enzyme required for sulfatase activity
MTHEAGEKRANAFSLFDTLGNVGEWVNDWYDAAYYNMSPPSDPQGPASGPWRVLRGGCWYNYPQYVRVSARYGKDAGAINGLNGIRCVGGVGNP